MCFEIPEDKFASVLEDAKFFLGTSKDNSPFPVKRLASWVEKLQSLRLAIGPVVSIMCRPLYQSIKDGLLLFVWGKIQPLKFNGGMLTSSYILLIPLLFLQNPLLWMRKFRQMHQGLGFSPYL